MINGEKEIEKKQIDVSLGTLYDVNKSIVNSMKKLSTEEIEELYKQSQFKKGHYKMFKDCLEYLKTK